MCLASAWPVAAGSRALVHEEHGHVMRDEGYLLNNQQAEAGRRLDALSELFDPATFRHLAAVGVTAGWVCWEVGAGGASVPALSLIHISEPTRRTPISYAV